MGQVERREVREVFPWLDKAVDSGESGEVKF